MTLIKCAKCKVDKASEAFRKDKRKRNGHQSWCKLCTMVPTAHRRKLNLRRRYDLSLDDVDRMLKLSDYACSICYVTVSLDSPTHKNKPHIDHDHVTGSIRGILCGHCNTGLGAFKDNPVLLDAAKAYLFNPPHQKD